MPRKKTNQKIDPERLARRVEYYIAERLGWDTGRDRTWCDKCQRNSYCSDSYCGRCGGPMSLVAGREEAINDIKSAIEFALGDEPMCDIPFG